jgi:hypothetical protein
MGQYTIYLQEKVEFLEDSLGFFNERCKLFHAFDCFPCFPDWLDLKAREFNRRVGEVQDAGDGEGLTG